MGRGTRVWRRWRQEGPSWLFSLLFGCSLKAPPRQVVSDFSGRGLEWGPRRERSDFLRSQSRGFGMIKEFRIELDV
ncbi:hypothetical protein NL676_011567 [Syzygium grande]|nr:hypothetical protein NL676_011567 [Syzygium grande]